MLTNLKIIYNKFMVNMQVHQITNMMIFLEILVMEIKGMIISYSSYKKRYLDKRAKKLIENIEKLESITDINTDLISAKT